MTHEHRDTRARATATSLGTCMGSSALRGLHCGLEHATGLYTRQGMDAVAQPDGRQSLDP